MSLPPTHLRPNAFWLIFLAEPSDAASLSDAANLAPFMRAAAYRSAEGDYLVYLNARFSPDRGPTEKTTLVQRQQVALLSKARLVLDPAKITIQPIGKLGARLFFAEHHGATHVTDDLAALLALTQQARTIDWASCAHFLHLGTPRPGRTLAANVWAVDRGHNLVLTRRGPRLSEAPPTPVDQGSLLSTTTLKDLLQGSLQDVGKNPGLLLSRGIDSSLLLALRAQAGQSYRAAFTAEFDPGYGINETEDAAATARLYGVEHVRVPVGIGEALAQLPEIVAAPTPMASWTAIAHRVIADRARALGCDALVSGLGSDELFCGYTSMAEYLFQLTAGLRASNLEAVSWPDLIRSRSEPTSSHPLVYRGIAEFFEFDELRDLPDRPAHRADVVDDHINLLNEYIEARPEKDILGYLIYHEIRHRLPSTLMPSFATNGLLSSGTIYPFLSDRIVSWSQSLTLADRISADTEKVWHKSIVYALARETLPRWAWDRPKGIYTVPMTPWLSEEPVRSWFAEQLIDSDDLLETLLSPAAFRRWRVTRDQMLSGGEGLILISRVEAGSSCCCSTGCAGSARRACPAVHGRPHPPTRSRWHGTPLPGLG